MNNFDSETFLALMPPLPDTDSLFSELSPLSGFLPGDGDEDFEALAGDLVVPTFSNLSRRSYPVENRFRVVFGTLFLIICLHDGRTTNTDCGALTEQLACALLSELVGDDNVFDVTPSSKAMRLHGAAGRRYHLEMPRAVCCGRLPVLALDYTHADYVLEERKPNRIYVTLPKCRIRNDSDGATAMGNEPLLSPVTSTARDPIMLDILIANGSPQRPRLRYATWIQLFALAMKARLADKTRDAYESFTARFDGYNLTIYAASFSKGFLETLPTAVPSDSAPRLYRSETIDLRSQEDRREAVRAFLGVMRYIRSTKKSEHQVSESA